MLLGVAFMAGSLVLGDTVGHTFDNLFSNVFKGTDAEVRAVKPFKAPDDGGPDQSRPGIDASLLETVKSTPGVAAAEGSVFGYTQVVDKKGKSIGNPGQGAPTFGTNWKTNLDLNAYHLVQGRAPAADDEVVLDAHSAKEGKYRVGDTAKVLTKAGALEVRVWKLKNRSAI